MMDFEKRSKELQEWLRQEFTGIRTGQAAPALLDSVKVESYGAVVPLQQVGSIGIEDARTLRVSPWDVGAIKSIETAINDSDLGVSVATDSQGLRVIFPELTADRRQQLLRLAKAKHEEARVSLRSARDEAMKEIDKAEKDGDISEDEKFTKRESLQKKVDAVNIALDEMLKEKEAEIAR